MVHISGVLIIHLMNEDLRIVDVASLNSLNHYKIYESRAVAVYGKNIKLILLG